MEELMKTLKEVIEKDMGNKTDEERYKSMVNASEIIFESVIQEYCYKDAESFIEFLNDEKSWSYVTNCEEDKEYKDKMAKVMRFLDYISTACKTTTIAENKKDLKLFANEIRKIADLMDEVSEIKENTKEEVEVNIEAQGTLSKEDAKELKKLIDKITKGKN